METIAWIFMLLAVAVLGTGCAGLGVRAEAYRIDEMKSQEMTHNKPLKCLFVACPEYDGEASHGS